MQTSTLAAAVLAAVPATAATYTIDADHSQVGFRVRHMMVANTRGEFRSFRGKVVYDEKNPGATVIEADIDAASVDTQQKDRDAHLRSPEFFDAEKFPTLTFRSKKAERAGDTLRVSGDLTIRGVTKPVVLEVSDLSGEVKDPWGNQRRGAVAKTRVNRKDFGMVWNASLDKGGVALADTVEITLEIELIRQAADKV